MEKKLNILSITYLLFLILLLLSGSLSGVVSDLVYFLAFIIPLAFGLISTRDEKVERGRFLVLDSEGLKRTLPVIFPTVSLVIILSYLTALLIRLITGRTNQVDVGDSFILALINHALLPAILEEALFRYLPMRLLSRHSKRGAVLISAFFFSLIHLDLFTIPYAFVAGIIFMTLDIALDSVIPSVIIHFINNALSVSLIIFADNPAFAPTLFVITGILALLSLVSIIGGDFYKTKLPQIFKKGGEEAKVTIPMLIFATFTLFFAIISIL